jgi:hypothetical protein
MLSPILRVCLAGLLPGFLLTNEALAQGVTTRKLGKPIAELAEPLSGAGDLRELRDGRLVVLDVKDNLLQLVSADLGTLQQISREGSGPAEYRRLMQLIPRAGDSTLAYDVMNARFLVIGGNGAATGTISLRDAAGGLPVGPMAVRGYDAGGRLFYQGMKLSMGPNGPALSDTSVILRLDPRSRKIDTLGHVRIGSPGMKMSGDMQKGTGAVRLSMPAYPIVDEWALLPDGRVVIVRGADYRIDFIAPTGVLTSRGVVPYDRVKVVEADKTRLREARKKMEAEITKAAASAASSMPNTGKGRVRMPSMAMEEPTEWPDVKPAFGQGALKITPDGELWIARHRAAGNEGQLFDVFTSAGVLRFHFELPPKSALVGFGPRHMYVVRVDEDELQYLQRHQRP